MIRALASSSQLLANDAYLHAAERAANFVLDRMRRPAGRIVANLSGRAGENSRLPGRLCLRVRGAVGPVCRHARTALAEGGPCTHRRTNPSLLGRAVEGLLFHLEGSRGPDCPDPQRLRRGTPLGQRGQRPQPGAARLRSAASPVTATWRGRHWKPSLGAGPSARPCR